MKTVGGRAGWGAAVLLLLAGCGVPASGVVPAGESATGIGRNTVLYFVRGGGLTALPDDSGQDTDLKPVLEVRERRADAVRFDVELAVWLLSAGPGPGYRSRGVTSEFPSIQSGRPAVSVVGSAVTVELPSLKEPLTALAARQLFCTAADAFLTVSPDTAPAEVTVRVPGRAVWRADAFGRTCA
ncbi:hypothetical protein [Streptomyces sp. NPDC101776]|uniref:hypothetical protein n=1 Tax=Streptomyces sp. NPDC101776 TaxID=3366146 RepID=UPI00381021F5